MLRRWKAVRDYLLKNRKGLLGLVGGVVLTVAGEAISVPVINYLYPGESMVEIEELITKEARYSLQAPCGADEYAALFTDDAQVEDIRGNALFRGRSDIADRFRSLPRFKTLVHDLRDKPKIVAERSAMAETTSTIEFAGERHTGREEWWFDRSEGEWKILRIRYNNP